LREVRRTESTHGHVPERLARVGDRRAVRVDRGPLAFEPVKPPAPPLLEADYQLRLVGILVDLNALLDLSPSTLNPRRSVLALILAGGEGGRLGPLTDERAKPALPFGGTYRLIDFPLSNCVHSGLSDVWVLQQYEPHELTSQLAGGRPWDLDRTRGGFRIVHPYLGDSESGWYKGNADALQRNRELIGE
jgi:Nucleotidyl transferase